MKNGKQARQLHSLQYIYCLGNCSAGFFLRATDNLCQECDKGSYQDQKWMTFCIPCGTDKTTENNGADREELCICECVKAPVIFSPSDLQAL